MSSRFFPEAPPRLSSVCQVSPALDDLIAHTLSLDPEGRPGSAKELCKLLVRIFEEEDGLADAEEVGSYVREQMAEPEAQVQGVVHVTETQERQER